MKKHLTLLISLSMSILLIFSKSLFVAPATASNATSWAMFHGDPAHSGYSTSVGPITNQTLWTFTTGSYIATSPAIVDGVVYIGSWDHNFYALNAYSGNELWSFTTEGLVDTSPCVYNGAVYVSSNVGGGVSTFYALNASTGSEIWRTRDFIMSSPTIVEGIVYMAQYPSVVAFNATDGNEIWRTYIGNNLGTSAPAVLNGVVYKSVQSGGNSIYGSIYALDDLTGNIIWSHATEGSIDSSPCVANNLVFVGSDDSKIYALDAIVGTEIWNYTTGGEVNSSPATHDGLVYVGSSDKNLYALKCSSGEKVWSYLTGGRIDSSPLVAGGAVYFTSYDCNFYALNSASGEKIWSYSTEAPQGVSSPAICYGALYVGSSDGKMYAFGSSDLFVVPEYAFGALLALGSCFCAFAVIGTVKKLKQHKKFGNEETQKLRQRGIMEVCFSIGRGRYPDCFSNRSRTYR